MKHRTLFALITLFTAVAILILWHARPPLPARWNPLAPLDLTDAPNFLTAYKLKRLRNDPARCHALLAEAGLRFTPVPDRTVARGCGFHNAVRIEDSTISYTDDFIASCPLAVGLALFERHVLQPSARATFGENITRIEHFGSYACRNIDHRQAGPRSQHATANALDVRAFRLEDGRTITVKRGWNAGDRRRVFLKRLHDGACSIFKGVLGPDYDTAHANHFHFDMGPLSVCR